MGQYSSAMIVVAVLFFCFCYCCCCCFCQQLSGSFAAAGSSSSSVYAEAQTRALELLRGHDGGNSSAELLLLVVSTAGAATEAALRTTTGDGTGDVIGKCSADLTRLLASLARREAWALAYADSVGKLPAGLFNGATTWLGSFDQCLAARGPPAGDSGGQGGTYCLMQLKQRHQSAGNNSTAATTLITIGTCWPGSCSMGDAVNVTSALLSELTRGQTIYAAAAAPECKRSGSEVRLTGGAIVMIVLLSAIGLCLAAGTGIDLCERSRTRESSAIAASTGDASIDDSEAEDDEETLVSTTEIGTDNTRAFKCIGALKAFLLCFSLRTNAAKILSTQTPEGNLKCINGIRFLSMSWIILGHTYVIGLLGVSNIAYVAQQWINDWKFQAILNASVAVDTFFVLSGLLAAYLLLRELDMRQGQLKRINWLRFYLHRYWRLTAPYMIILGAYATLTQYLYDGPRNPSGGFDPNCGKTWWHNLLYINNLVPNVQDMCMPWSWYLANDMQFYAVSPLFLVPVAYKPALGVVAIVAAIAASTIATGVHSTATGQQAGVLDGFPDAYVRPWFRIGPYLVGTLAGLIAHRVLAVARRTTGATAAPRRRLRLHWAGRLLGWALAAGLCLSVLYGLFDAERGRTRLPQLVASLYNATFRLAWSLGVALVVLACISGNGGWVADLLSAGVFAPLSRLSYCAYLLHPVVMAVVETARRDAVQWNAWTPVGNYFAYLLASYLLALVASLALESPFIALERLASGRQ